MLAVAAAVLIANLPYLLGLFDPNPLGTRSALVTEVVPGVLDGGSTIDPNNGATSQALGHRAVLDWLDFRIPWWNPYEGTGAPLAGEMQSAALFPPTFLTLFANGQLFERMLLEIIAGISTYLLLRRISVRRSASAAGGIAFGLSGTFAWFAHAAINPVAFLPLTLLGIELAYAATVERRRGGWWLIAVAGALSVYAGFPEVVYIDALLVLCWVAWRAGCARRDTLRAFAAKIAAGVAAGTLLAAPLLIAFVGYLDDAYAGAHEGDVLRSLALPKSLLRQLILPYVYGPIGTGLWWGGIGGYLATSVLLFALVGLLSRGRRGLRLLLLTWSVLALARMYDQPHFLAEVVRLIPGMSQVWFSRYAFVSLEFAVVVLAALGLDDIAMASDTRRRVVAGAAAALLFVALAAIGARTLANAIGNALRGPPYYELTVVWGAGIVLAAATVAAVIRNARARAGIAALLVAVDALALFMVPQLSAPRKVRVDMAPVAYLRRNLGTSRFFTLGPLQPNYGTYFGIASLNLNDVPMPRALGRYVRARLDASVNPSHFVGTPALVPGAASPRQELMRNLAGYRAAGVAYVLTPAGNALPQSRSTFRLVLRTPTTWIYRLAGAAPYFTANRRACVLKPQSRRSVRVICPEAATLVRRETDLPGWSARVDGKPATVGRSDGLFQTVNVEPGVHEVEFSYRPPKMVWGYLAFATGCGWLGFAAATGVRRRRARRRT